MQIRFYSSARDTTGEERTFTIDEFVREFTHPPQRSKMAVGTPEERTVAKEQAPAWSPGNTRNSKGLRTVGVLAFDFDKGTDGQAGLTQENMEELYSWLEDTGYRYVLHDTFSSGFVHPRRKVRLILFFEDDVSRGVFDQVQKQILDELPVPPDPAALPPARIFFKPHVHESHQHYECKTGGSKCVGLSQQDPFDRLRNTNRKWETLRSVAFSFGLKGGNVDELWDKCREALEVNPEPVADWDKAEELFRSRFAAAQREAGRWRGTLSLNEDGKVLNNDINVRRILSSGAVGEFKLNERTELCEMNGKEVRDTDWAEVAERIEKETGMQPRRRMLLEAVGDQCRVNPYDPFLDEVSALKWDGKERLDTWLARICTAEGNEEYLALVGSKWLISLIARTIRPDCQVDTMLVLVGEQGIGKSSVAKVIGGEYVLRLTGDIRDKDTAIKIAKATIVEISELANIRGKENEPVKAFVSGTKEIERRPFERFYGRIRRRSIFLGTTNSEDFLSDPTGNRRYWPVKCGEIDVEKLRNERTQLLAEARARFEKGEKWWLDEEEAKLLAPVHADHEVDNPYENGLETLRGGLSATQEQTLGVEDWQRDYGKLVRMPRMQIYEYLGARNGIDRKAVDYAIRKKGWKTGRTEKRKFVIIPE